MEEDEEVQGQKGGFREINEEHAPQNQSTESDYLPGIGSDLKPFNGDPVPSEGFGKN